MEYITQYKNQLVVKRYAPNTVRAYLSQIKNFLNCFGKDAKNISAKEIEQYIQKCVELDKISFLRRKMFWGQSSCFIGRFLIEKSILIIFIPTATNTNCQKFCRKLKSRKYCLVLKTSNIERFCRLFIVRGCAFRSF